MKTKLAGKVLAGMFFILCCGLEAHSQSSGQDEVKFDNLNAGSFRHGNGTGGINSGKEGKHKLFKAHHVYTFKVLFNNGVEKEITGRIKYSKEDSTYTLASKHEAIRAADTQYIYRVDKASGDTIAGTSYENSWLFPVVRGKINGYSTYAEKNAGYITHISRAGSGQLQSLESGDRQAHEQTADMLTAMVTGNEAAEQLMREHKHKARRKDLIKKIALGGLGFTIVGAVAPPFATAFIVGVPVGVGAGVATATVRTVDLLEVIHTYNTTEAIAFF
ncbi:hypothetical protein GCM10027443_40320 [Pontibacter brevis]